MDIRDTHVDTLLSGLSVGFYNDPAEYIVQEIAPELAVNFRSDIVPKYKMDEIFRDSAEERGPATESSGSDFDVDTTQHYFARNFAHHTDVAWEAYANVQAPFEIDQSKTRFVTDKVKMKRETFCTTRLVGTGIWTGYKDLTAGANKQWTDATSKPALDVENARMAVSGLIARNPNKLLLGEEVYSALSQHPDFIDRVKYTQTGVVTDGLMAALFKIDKVLHSNALINTNKQGMTLSRIVGKVGLFVYVTPAPAMWEPSAAYMFNWSVPGIGGPVYMRRIPMPLKKADRFEADTYIDVAVTMPDAGYFFDHMV